MPGGGHQVLPGIHLRPDYTRGLGAAGKPGVGGAAAFQLAAAGIGRLVLAHGGNLKPSDLNRQLLMKHDWLGKPRVECAARTTFGRRGRSLSRTAGLPFLPALGMSPWEKTRTQCARSFSRAEACAARMGERASCAGARVAAEGGGVLNKASHHGP